VLLRFFHFHYNFLEIRISHNCNARQTPYGRVPQRLQVSLRDGEN